MASPRVLVIYNEPILPADHPDAASEIDVIESTGVVVKFLQSAGFSIRQLGFSFDPRPLLDELRDHPPDVVFNMFEGLAAQTATEISVAGLLEWLNVPFTGSPSFAIALGRDKIRTQNLLRGGGLNVANSQVIEQTPVAAWPHAWPAIIKPACQDCSVGIDQDSVVTNQLDLERRVAYTLERYGAPVLVEEFIFGRELHANIIEEPGANPAAPDLVCIPLCEIRFAEERVGKGYWPIYSYEAKWNMSSDEFKNTPLGTVVDVPPAWSERIRRDALLAYKLIGLRDCGRIDLRVTEDGRPFILEVNPNPYLHGEGVIDGLKAIGRSHAKFIENMVWLALARGNVGRVQK
jgi:D-alanine-D-alanine ligase